MSYRVGPYVALPNRRAFNKPTDLRRTVYSAAFQLGPHSSVLSSRALSLADLINAMKPSYEDLSVSLNTDSDSRQA